MTGSHCHETAGERQPDGVPAFQVGHVYLDVSRREVQLLNAEATRLRADGLPFTAADPMIPNLYTGDGRSATAADLPLVMCWGTGKPAQARFLWEVENGRTRQVFWSAAPLPPSGGPLLGILGSVTCAEASARPAAEPVWQQLAGLAHDLSAPLHSLALITEALERVPVDQGELHRRLQVMQRAANRALEISADLLRHCRGPAPLARREQDWLGLDSLVIGLTEEHSVAATLKGLTIAADLANIKGWEVFTDHIALGRLLSNLVGNAVRYTAVGGIKVTASWRGERGRASLALCVTDTGQGISPEEKESIFQAFTRGKAGADSKVHGSGLGLAVVERLAQELGLQLELYSEAETGSTFTVLIPATLMRKAEDVRG